MEFQRGAGFLTAIVCLAACVRAPPPVPVEPLPPKTLPEAVSFTDAGQPNSPATGVGLPSPAPTPVDVEALLSALSLEQKVGQLMMVGFSGLYVDAKVEELLKGKQVGGVCMFKRNIESAEQIARLNDSVRNLLAANGGIPPFLAVDQEGGNVVRISDRIVVLPGNMALGATRDKKLARAAGRAQAEDLRRLGFNMNLAPVLDVNVNPANPVIGIRSFSDQVELVKDLGTEFVLGQQEANLATIAKHFPGHGSVDSDSHKALPVLSTDEKALLHELEPFEAAIGAGLDGLMTAHISAPNVTGDDVPATLNARLLKDLLRHRMGFKGLVLTDELEMQAIVDGYGVGRAAVMAVVAGADMVLIPWRPEKKNEVHAALLEAARNGELSKARLDDAVRHILTLKAARGVFDAPQPLEERLSQLGREREVAEQIARGSMTLLRAEKGVLPLTSNKKIAVITTESSLLDAIAARAPNTVGLVVPAYPREADRAGLKLKAREVSKGADVVVVAVSNQRQVELAVNAALAGKPTIVVVLGAPYLSSQVSEARAVLLTYSYQPAATRAAAEALFGERGTPGKLPVALPRVRFGFGMDLTRTPIGAGQP